MIVTDEASEKGFSAESGEAASDVSSAARGSLTANDFSDGDRGVGGELIEASVIKLIEHDITEDEDPAGGSAIKEG